MTAEAIAQRLTKVQHMVAQTCGDVKDRFPCKLCGAIAPRECGVSSENRRAAAQAVIDAGGYDALAAAILVIEKGVGNA